MVVVYAHRGNIYFGNKGFTKRHLSLAERPIPLVGPDSNLPSSSPASSSSAASGVYGSADRGGGGLRNSSYVEGAKESRNAVALGRRKKYVNGIIKGRT